MTTPRKRTPKKVQQDVEVSTDTLTTYTIEVETDPEILYPPVSASQAVGFGEVGLRYEVEKVPTWKKYPYIPPIVIVAVALIVGIWTLAI